MRKKTLLRIIAVALAMGGVAILAFIIYPIASYKPKTETAFRESKPIPVSGEEQKEVQDNPVDYTKASNWFTGDDSVSFESSTISFYTISVPSLKIENATVAIGGEDLADHLIQYPGTALPGKRGNAVIFGHSVLPQFFNPKNYISIFSTLPTLKKGDEINVSYDGVSYKFRVENMFEVAPSDLQVLEQNLSDAFLTLVTCVPPGDPFKPRRLIVRARVVPLEGSINNAGFRN